MSDATTAGLSTFEGGCTCRRIRHRLASRPLFVHCCHCRWCQRETGTAFALNALIEADRVELLAGEVDVVDTPSESGQGQRISRCPTCRVAVWISAPRTSSTSSSMRPSSSSSTSPARTSRGSSL